MCPKPFILYLTTTVVDFKAHIDGCLDRTHWDQLNQKNAKEMQLKCLQHVALSLDVTTSKHMRWICTISSNLMLYLKITDMVQNDLIKHLNILALFVFFSFFVLFADQVENKIMDFLT